MDKLVAPPNRYVRKFACITAAQGLMRILDIGFGEGRHSFYLAEMGHKVVGTDPDLRYVTLARERAYAKGLHNANFIHDDVLRTKIGAKFGAVIMNDVLQHIPKHRSPDALYTAQRLVDSKGYSVVSGYLHDPKVDDNPAFAKTLVPGELEAAYDSKQWEILHYEEEPHSAQYLSSGPSLQSHASIIAQRKY